jgi:ABC-type branched-subunit amino acid transport system substrate-binding protein
MSRRNVRAAQALTALALAGLLAACADRATTSDTTSTGGDSGAVQTGAGVTDSTITVGVLTDLSGPFAAGATIQVAEAKAYWDQVNSDGGVCGRNVEMDVQDHGYDPQKAVSLYRSMSPNVVALQQVLGSPVVAAVLPLAQEDDLYVGGMGWASVTLQYDNAQLPGSTYSIEAANAVDYMVDNLGLKDGDSIGHVYFEGDYGGDSLKGAEYAAEQRGLTVVSQAITPQDQDLSAQASALQKAGVKGVIIGAAPPQMASLAGSLAALGMDVPIFGNTPSFGPSLLNTPAKDALVKNGYTVQSITPYAGDGEDVTKAEDLYTQAAPDGDIGWEVPLSYAQSLLVKTALDNACEAKDLTPAGVVAGMRATANLDTGGLFPSALDYSDPAEPPTRTVFVNKVDPDVEGGLKIETTLEGPSAKSYTFGG